jgi:hypothetical protein
VIELLVGAVSVTAFIVDEVLAASLEAVRPAVDAHFESSMTIIFGLAGRIEV